MEKPVIEVIIPTYRPDSQVIELVRRLKKQTVPPDRIHMIDTRSGSFPEELEEDPGIKLNRNILTTEEPGRWAQMHPVRRS